MSFLDIMLTITFILSLFVKSSLRHFGIFLGIYWITEILLTNWSAKYFGSNILIYNIFVLFIVAYYLYVFSRSIKEWIIFLMFYLATWTISMSVIDVHAAVVSKSYALGLVMVGVLIIREIRSKLNSSAIDHFFEDSKFWFGLGILLFLSCSFPILMFADLLIVSQSARNIYDLLLGIGNVLLYLSYLMVLICETKWIKLLGL